MIYRDYYQSNVLYHLYKSSHSNEIDTRFEENDNLLQSRFDPSDFSAHIFAQFNQAHNHNNPLSV